MTLQTNSNPIKLSKSEYILGLQCKKALWLAKNRKDIKFDIDASIQARFDLGNEVGDIARQYFDKGTMIANAYFDIKKAAQTTQQFIADGEEIIYEAAAYSEEKGIFCLVDILQKVPTSSGEDTWNLIEVKSSTSVKDYHLDDISFQYHVFTECGYNIEKCYIMHIDNTYVRGKALEPHRFLKLADVTDTVLAKKDEIEQNFMQFQLDIQEHSEPQVEIDVHCTDPFDCKYSPLCWKDIPDYSILNIFRKKQAFEIAKLLKSYNIQDLPEEEYPNTKKVDIESYKTNTPFIDTTSIKEWLEKLEFPLYFLDYETIFPAIPVFENSSPYQQIPFQYSLHVLEKLGAEAQHFEFIHQEQSDPRHAFTQSLIQNCGTKGTIIAYNATFETSRNNELAQYLPEHADALYAINARVVDLLVPFKQRMLYSPKQQGSASIKSVLPAFTDLKYDNMEIANGQEASDGYQSYLLGKYPNEELQNLWLGLSKYCELDSYAMLKLLEVLWKYVEVEEV